MRLVIYPFASYACFRFTYKLSGSDIAIDPWYLYQSISIQEVFEWTPEDVPMFTIHISCGFLAYFFSWIACFMTLHRSGLVIPTQAATPASVLVFICMAYFKTDIGFKMDRIFQADLWLILALVFSAFLWIGQLVITAYPMWKEKNVVLASGEDMYVRPYYSSILLEQYLILNRDVSQYVNRQVRNSGSTVFICTTMFRENATEMRQMLESLKGVAEFYKSNRNASGSVIDTKFESHIFLDNGCNGDEIKLFGVQLLSLIPETFGVQAFVEVELNGEVKRKKTPYGCRFQWFIENDKNSDGNDIFGTGMPVVVHFKDNNKVRKKKRWSQVMYMNYVINHRAREDSLDLNNTFILTTDADIAFKAESAVVLLYMLARDPHVGAVSCRTHPKGSGLLYWYQVFDYAVAHWLQKPAEHILGCVLCCPGCFSIFRCSALKDCLKTYSEEVTGAFDFLTKDMGEDRWLCTLLIKNMWRLDYCAVSEDKTFCPEDFDEFFKQRRRWIPSTLADLGLLVSSFKEITRNNKSINFLFILYQLLIILSTIISPATVILIMSSSLGRVFAVNQIALVTFLFLISVLYGLACVFTNQRTQLDFAKLLTQFFATLMAIAVVGVVKGIVTDVEKFVENNATHNSELPFAASTFYTLFFALVFLITALLHNELIVLIHSFWYLLGLPGGYLVLLIYSAANLNSTSWGTREAVKDNDNENIVIVLFKKLKMLIIFSCRRKMATEQQNLAVQVEEQSLQKNLSAKDTDESDIDQKERQISKDTSQANAGMIHIMLIKININCFFIDI